MKTAPILEVVFAYCEAEYILGLGKGNRLERLYQSLQKKQMGGKLKLNPNLIIEIWHTLNLTCNEDNLRKTFKKMQNENLITDEGILICPQLNAVCEQLKEQWSNLRVELKKDPSKIKDIGSKIGLSMNKEPLEVLQAVIGAGIKHPDIYTRMRHKWNSSIQDINAKVFLNSLQNETAKLLFNSTRK